MQQCNVSKRALFYRSSLKVRKVRFWDARWAKIDSPPRTVHFAQNGSVVCRSNALQVSQVWWREHCSVSEQRLEAWVQLESAMTSFIWNRREVIRWWGSEQHSLLCFNAQRSKCDLIFYTSGAVQTNSRENSSFGTSKTRHLEWSPQRCVESDNCSGHVIISSHDATGTRQSFI